MTAVSAERTVSVLKLNLNDCPEGSGKEPTQSSGAPQLITVQLARKWGKKQCFWQQLRFPVALNNAFAKGGQGPCRAGRITHSGRGTT